MNKITLCMIVKDEELHLVRCLESVKNLVSEIIIVDTGSTDNTKSVAETFGATLFDYEWKNHFADARNFALTHATGDWILTLDADEWLEADACSVVKEEIKSAQSDIFTLPIWNYYGNQLPIDTNQIFFYHQPRLFRNHKGIHYKNKIHEVLQIEQTESKVIEAPIQHIGYIEEVTQNKNKLKRNTLILEEALEQNTSDPWITYHLASEYYRLKKYSIAFELVNHSILCFLVESIKPPTLLYRLKYTILLETNSIDGASAGIDKAIELYPDYVDLHYLRGLILMKKEQYAEAIRSFESCLLMGESNKHYLIQKGVGSFLAEEYKQICETRIEVKSK